MTHSDIYKKFMIEYDKANVTSSYPSLTEYEVATLLDKAYLALIAQKLTGNNLRRIGFEQDVKSIEDLRPLMISKTMPNDAGIDVYASNDLAYKIPDKMLYFLQGFLQRSIVDNYNKIDNQKHNVQNVMLVSHQNATKFMATDSNLPWIPKPVCFIDSSSIHVLVDSYKLKTDNKPSLKVVYIMSPEKFVDNLTKKDTVKFELSDSMAEELINMAIVFATNIVESQKLQSQVSLLKLES